MATPNFTPPLDLLQYASICRHYRPDSDSTAVVFQIVWFFKNHDTLYSEFMTMDEVKEQEILLQKADFILGLNTSDLRVWQHPDAPSIANNMQSWLSDGESA